MDLPEITEIKRLTVRPGDRLVVRLDTEPDDEQLRQLSEQLPQLLGTDVPIILMPPSMDIFVIGPDGT